MINSTELTEHLLRLLPHRGWTADGRSALTAHFVEWLTARGIPNELVPVSGGYALVAETGPATGPVLLLTGHIDTVEPSDKPTEPEGAVRGSWLYGTGCGGHEGRDRLPLARVGGAPSARRRAGEAGPHAG